MKKLAAIFSIIFGVTVLTISTSRSLMEKITAKREAAPWGSWWGPHQVAGGDLVRMAYLEDILRFRDTVTHTYSKAPKGNGSVNLYLSGDSYVKDIPDSAFYGLKSFHFGRRSYSILTYNLDTAETNILIISLGERFLQRLFYTPDNIYWQLKKAEQTAAWYALPPAKHVKHYAGIGLPGIKAEDFFNPVINQNIEYNLFSYNVINSIRQFKANLNAHIFKRASGNVVISDDGSRLFIAETVTPRGMESSYAPVSPDLVSYHISIINQVYEHYRNEGFDEVYLAVIPNPVSVLQPTLYNGMLPDLQNHNRGYGLKIPVIDVYSVFVKDPARYYLKGDTHWNPEGTHLWIEKVNAMLKAWDDNDSTRRKLRW